ncbi:hypothetical protein LBMAG35_06980 [Chlorobiota bacterium]|nr:hypothetical protein LBMAG35_06980 [Chlorobiota bacterium]
MIMPEDFGRMVIESFDVERTLQSPTTFTLEEGNSCITTLEFLHTIVSEERIIGN